MAELARELGDRPVLIASSDKFVSAIARCEHELRGSYRLSNSAALQGQLAEKSSQYRLAADYGLPLPLTKFVGSEHDLITAADAMSFPCLLKPNHFREWLGFESGHRLYDRKIAIARSASELLQIYRLAEPVTPSVIIQDLIQGDDRAKRVYLSCRDAGGRKIGSAVFRELRCDPVQFGPATVSEPVEDHDVESTCDQFLSRIGYTGICEFEMKWDSRDGKLRLIEANPRLSGGGDAAPYAGVDLCWLHYLDLIGQCVDPVAPDGTSFRHIVLRSDGSAIPAYRRAGLISWREIFESYRAPRAFYDLDWHDWRYSLETLAVAATNLVRGFLSRRGGRDT
jgi:predicted ATP-grasp superfamily ATP-dependent carboligase